MRIKWALSRFSPFNSANTDRIFPTLLHKRIDVLTPHLIKPFRTCITWGYIPTDCIAKVRVVYLPKIGKTFDLTPKSYRPISLSSLLPETLEMLVDRYIRDKLQQRHNGVLS